MEIIPQKKLVLTWAEPETPEDISRITFEIESIENTVCLTVTHGNFKANSETPHKVSKGWPQVLSSLKSFLETGTGLKVGCAG